MAIAAGADALGLVGAMPSGPGIIADDHAAEIIRTIPPPVTGFLLTSQLTAEGIARHAEAVGAQTVQIVRHIDPAESGRLAKIAPSLRRVQVIHVEDDAALRLIGVYADHVHAFLLDSGRPGLAVPELGGTGRPHDWSVSAEFVLRSPLPVFLAGGLGPANAESAIATVRPFGLDICSGVRTDGALDETKLRAFVEAARRADSRIRP